jgi:hypothetical protein
VQQAYFDVPDKIVVAPAPRSIAKLMEANLKPLRRLESAFFAVASSDWEEF